MLPAIPCPDDSHGATDMLKAIRGYTTDEVVTAAAIGSITPNQALAIVRALASRSMAKESRKAAKAAA